MKSVVITIPTFNEEKNILNILADLKEQKINNFKILNILVVDDASTDKTLEKVKTFPDKRIRIIRGRNRLGKAKRMNEIFKTCEADILIQYDADIRLKDRNTTANMVNVFNNDPSVDIVFGKQIPLKPETYVEQLAYFGFFVWEDIKESLGPKANRYRVHGQIRAFNKKFYTSYQVFDNRAITEDTFSFYYAMQNNKRVIFQKKCIAYFKLASTFRDYVKQMSRFIQIGPYVEAVFDRNIINKYEVITSKMKLKYFFLRSLRTLPHISIGYFLLHTYARIYSKFFKTKPLWEISKSTKLLSDQSI